MARQALIESATAEAVRRTRIQEVMFDDFFGKKLSDEGFTIEKVAEGYCISSNQPSPLSPATDAPSSAASPVIGGHYA